MRRLSRASIPAAPPRSGEATSHKRFRYDIQGLRAVAIIIGVLFHSRFSLVPGGYIGIDVFFVISGFLITDQLLSELARRDSISLTRFYARRIKRLLPVSTLVLAVTVIAAWALLTPDRAAQVINDGYFVVIYALNIHLAAQGVNYLQATAPVSPLEHYWSLAVEEQFYFIWPVAVLLVWLLIRRVGQPANRLAGHRLGLGLLLIAVIAVSFTLSVTVTAHSAPWAYFSPFTRAWQLATGCLLAVCAPRLRDLPESLAAVATWAGLALILAAALIDTRATPYPGSAALVPVLGAALVVGAGCAAPRQGAERMLGLAPMQRLGELSYGWYLWHYPLLIGVAAYVGHALPVGVNLLLVLIGLALAALSYELVEQPIRNRESLSLKPWRGLALGLALALCGLTVTIAAHLTLRSSRGTGAAVTAPALPYARTQQAIAPILAQSAAMRKVPANLTPSLNAGSSDEPVSYHNGCFAPYSARVPHPAACAYGDTQARATVVLYGDSHADQWQPALAALGVRDRFRLIEITKALCPVGVSGVFNPFLERAYTECDAWHERAMRDILALHPALVVMSSAVTDGGQSTGTQNWAADTAGTVRTLTAAGIRTLYIADTPHTASDGPGCVAQHLADLRACALARSRAFSDPERRRAVIAAAAGAGAQIFDPSDLFCTQTRCLAVVANLLVYRDDQHLTATYARWLAPALAGPLQEAALPGTVLR